MQLGEVKDGLVGTETIGCYQHSIRGGGVDGSSVARRTVRHRCFFPFGHPLVNLRYLYGTTKAFLAGTLLSCAWIFRHPFQVAFHA